VRLPIPVLGEKWITKNLVDENEDILDEHISVEVINDAIK